MGDALAERAWSGYPHRFDDSATRAERTAAGGAFVTALMRLAAAGTPPWRNAAPGS